MGVLNNDLQRQRHEDTRCKHRGERRNTPLACRRRRAEGAGSGAGAVMARPPLPPTPFPLCHGRGGEDHHEGGGGGEVMEEEQRPWLGMWSRRDSHVAQDGLLMGEGSRSSPSSSTSSSTSRSSTSSSTSSRIAGQPRRRRSWLPPQVAPVALLAVVCVLSGTAPTVECLVISSAGGLLKKGSLTRGRGSRGRGSSSSSGSSGSSTGGSAGGGRTLFPTEGRDECLSMGLFSSARRQGRKAQSPTVESLSSASSVSSFGAEEERKWGGGVGGGQQRRRDTNHSNGNTKRRWGARMGWRHKGREGGAWSRRAEAVGALGGEPSGGSDGGEGGRDRDRDREGGGEGGLLSQGGDSAKGGGGAENGSLFGFRQLLRKMSGDLEGNLAMLSEGRTSEVMRGWGGALSTLQKKTEEGQLQVSARLRQVLGWEEEKAEQAEIDSIRDDYAIGALHRTPRLVSRTAEWQRLQARSKVMKRDTHLKDLMRDEARSQSLCAEFEGSFLDYSRMQVDKVTMKLLFELAERQQLRQKIAAMFRGDPINNTENRAVLHTALRAEKTDPPIMIEGENVIDQVHSTLEQVKDFSEEVRSGAIRGATGKPIRNIVAVGIGGSYLGPEFIHEAFSTEESDAQGRDNKSDFYSLRFLSNVDPVDVRRTLYDLDPEETLVIVISKTFVTAETMLNARTARQWLWDSMGKGDDVVEKHMAACSSESSLDKVRAFGIRTERLFPFWDWVGGRYSACSSVGALPLSLKYGYTMFERFLAGARSMDLHFLNTPWDRNLPVLMGLLGVWNMSFMGYKTRTILPYAEALLKLPAHIQQLCMESSGKRVTRNGDVIDYDIGQIDFGEPGTNGQHSFFQLLHMGQVCPAEFIGFIESQHHLHVEGEDIASHDELMANFFAQPDALAMGKTAKELLDEGCPPDLVPHRTFAGDRPSLSLLLPKVNAYYLGQILAIYEHRTATEGFMWDINSFDQWGVELGKSLASNVRNKMKDFRDGGAEKALASSADMQPATRRLLLRYLEHSDSLCKVKGTVNHRSMFRLAIPSFLGGGKKKDGGNKAATHGPISIHEKNRSYAVGGGAPRPLGETKEEVLLLQQQQLQHTALLKQQQHEQQQLAIQQQHLQQQVQQQRQAQQQPQKTELPSQLWQQSETDTETGQGQPKARDEQQLVIQREEGEGKEQQGGSLPVEQQGAQGGGGGGGGGGNEAEGGETEEEAQMEMLEIEEPLDWNYMN